MNPETKQTTAVYVKFQLVFYNSYYSIETIELFSYQQEHFDEEIGYYWDILSDEAKEKIIKETYNHWYQQVCERLAIRQYSILSEVKE